MARRGRSKSGLGGISLTELRRELTRRERRLPALNRRRNRLLAKVAALDAQIAGLGGAGAGGRGRTASGKRFQNEMSLSDTLASALKGKTMSIGDAMDAVQRSGYRTTSKTFRVQVNLALIKDPRFKRVGRGEYTAK